jgi:hypothetical protein
MPEPPVAVLEEFETALEAEAQAWAAALEAEVSQQEGLTAKASQKGGWIGVDLDGTLAYYDPEADFDPEKVGPPVPKMVARVKRWLAEGKTVKILTARVASGNGIQKFDPDQPRDESGKWTKGGGEGGGGGVPASGKYLGANSLDQPEMQVWAKSLKEGMDHIERTSGPQRALLHRNLLAVGGHGVGFQDDVDVDLVNAHGQIYTSSVVAGPGTNGYCHWNVAALYRKGEVDAIGTGYVLDSAKMCWRQHSWGFRRDKIVETTPANIGAAGYFGVRLTRQEAKAFIKKIGPLP